MASGELRDGMRVFWDVAMPMDDGPVLHDHPRDRPPECFAGNTLHAGRGHSPSLLPSMIPALTESVE